MEGLCIFVLVWMDDVFVALGWRSWIGHLQVKSTKCIIRMRLGMERWNESPFLKWVCD